MQTSKLLQFFIEAFGQDKDINSWQMSIRGLSVFIIALILIRIAGRRSFGIKSPFDNIIGIMLGAILSRAVVGASPFIPIVTTCLVIVIAHRSLGWLVVNNKRFGQLIEGNEILLFEKGKFINENMKKGLVGEADILQGVRKSALTDQLEKIDKIFIERNGEISAIKK